MLTRYVERDLVWIDLIAPTPGEVRSLMAEFDLAPHVAQELLSVSYKSKMERAGDALYVIFHFPTLRLGLSRRPEQEIDFLIGKKFLITTRYENIDPLHSFARSFEANTLLGRPHHTHGGHLFVAMLESLYKAIDEECDLMRSKLEEIETRIFKGEESKMVFELSSVARVLYDFRRSLSPHKDMLSSMEPVSSRIFGPEFSYHLRQAEGMRARVERTVESMRDSLGELRATNDSLLSTKQNETMKNLTIMALLTFPLSLLAALFTIEAKSRPIVGMQGDFWIITGIMATIATVLLVVFKRNKWI